MSDFSLDAFATVLSTAAPLALAASGAAFTEATGALNVGIEGAMLVGAFVAPAVAAHGGPVAALAAALAVGALFSLVQSMAGNAFRANGFVVGIAANLLALGCVSLLAPAAFGSEGVMPIEALAALDAAGSALQPLPGKAWLYLPAFALTLMLAAVFHLTVFGIRVRAVGMSRENARIAGLNPDSLSAAAFALSGAAASLAGAALAFDVSAYVPNLSSGYGWISLVLVYLGGKKPLGILAASLVFGVALAVSNLAQGFGYLPAEFALAIPQVLALAAYLAWSYLVKTGKKRS